MYSHVACDVMKERTVYLLKPSSLIWHLMPYLFLLKITAAIIRHMLIGVSLIKMYYIAMCKPTYSPIENIFACYIADVPI